MKSIVKNIKASCPSAESIWRPLFLMCVFNALICMSSAVYAADSNWARYDTTDNSAPTPRHEAGGLVMGNKLFAMGGRGNRPVERLDTQTGSWEFMANAPEEMHHFQPVEWGGKIYVIGALTCCYPTEPTISHIWIFDPVSKTWTAGANIPTNRLRGSTGAAVYNNKIYIVGGNTLGHNGGAVNWFDEYDPATDSWTVMPDAPNARDHFTAAIVGNKLIAAAGRESVQPSSELRKHNVETVDVFDFSQNTWVSGYDDIPTPRAGTVAVAYKQEVIVTGGETSIKDAERVTEALDVDSGTWRTLDDMIDTRHGHVGGVIGDVLYMSCGNELRGGGAELDTTETLDLSGSGNTSNDSDGDDLSDADETDIYGTDPTQADTDNDNLTDGDEVLVYNTDPLKSDTDDDLLTDSEELNQHNTNPNNPDTDGDNLSDSDEVIEHNTNPLESDTDGDSLSDSAELTVHLTDPLKRDTDSDTLDDDAELLVYETDPLLADSDQDTLNDASEINTHNTNPLKPDSDDDGISDGVEIANSTDPLDPNDPADNQPAPEPEEPPTGSGEKDTTSGSGPLSPLLIIASLMLLSLRRSRLNVLVNVDSK